MPRCASESHAARRAADADLPPRLRRGSVRKVTFEETLARLASLTDRDLGERRWAWKEAGRLAGARYAFDRSVEQEHDAAVQARAGWRPPVAARILGLAQLAFGDLRGVLVAMPDELLDPAPAAGEWSVRQTCEHAIRVERSYRAAIEWALSRGDGDAVRIPEALRPKADPADTTGSARWIAARFAIRRAETDAALRETPDGALARPSVWRLAPGVELTVDVRLRLHRLATHLQEHTIQVEKALEALGWRPGDAPRAVRRLSVARAMHERISDPAVIAQLDADHARKADELGA